MKNLFKISTKLQLRSKATKYNILFLTIMILLMIFLFTFKESLKNYVNSDIDRQFNLFFAIKIPDKEDYNWSTKELDEMQKEIRKISHVTFTTYQYAFGTYFKFPDFENDKLEGYAMVYAASNDTLPEISNGTNFPDDKGDYLICPENFYPTSVYAQKNELTSKDKIDLNPYLNKNITLEYDSRIKEHKNANFKIVGTYKNDKNNFDENICYSNRSAMIKIGQEVYEGYKDEVSNTEAIKSQTKIFFRIDSYENAKFVEDELQKLGYIMEDGFIFTTEVADKIFYKLNNFIVMAIICIIVIEIILFRNFKIENENNFNLLYVLGYKKKNILIIYILSNIIQIFISLLISALILLIGLGILYLVLSIYPFIFDKYQICISYLSPLIVVCLTILAAAINYISVRNKINGEFHEPENNNI